MMNASEELSYKLDWLYRVLVDGVETYRSMDVFNTRSHWLSKVGDNPDSIVVMMDRAGNIYERNING